MSYEALARAMFHDAGGRKRRPSAGIVTSAFCLLVISMMVVGCGTDSPSSPNTPGQLTGQTTNQLFSFSGSIRVTSASGTVAADDMSTVTISAEVNDSGGLVPNGMLVRFHTDLGVFVDPVTGLTDTTFNAGTFNGVAEVEFQSLGRQTGTANITASISDKSSSTKVVLEPAAVSGTLSLFFDAGPAVVKTGESANQNEPLDVIVGVSATGLDGTSPASGATVRFNIVQDTTDEAGPNDAAHWLVSSTTVTGSTGAATNILRVYGSGVVVMEAELIDPTTGDVLARSNRIILTTTASLIVKLAFNDGSTTHTGNAPYSVGLVSAVYDGTNIPRPGMQVRFTIESDSTGGATLSSTIGTTDASGKTTTSVRLPGAGSVTIKAALYDAENNVIASATVVATGT